MSLKQNSRSEGIKDQGHNVTVGRLMVYLLKKEAEWCSYFRHFINKNTFLLFLLDKYI